MSESEKLYTLSSSPHIRAKRTTPQIMMHVLIALSPAFIASFLTFGFRAVIITATALLSSILTEHLLTKHLLKKPSPIGDLSAAITGVLLAFNLPVSTPLWMVALGSFFAIAVVKIAFGGLGGNIVNPALAGRAFLMASYPAALTGTAFISSGRFGKIPNLDASTGATPLQYFSSIDPLSSGYMDGLLSLFTGNITGSIGETSAAAILIGGIYLFITRVISPLIPLTFIATVFVLSFLQLLFINGSPITAEAALMGSLWQILSGGLFLGAFFMATDMVTNPVTAKGQFIFALGCGAITVFIRFYGGYPEGVSYAILLMNLATPLIDRATPPKVYGRG